MAWPLRPWILASLLLPNGACAPQTTAGSSVLIKNKDSATVADNGGEVSISNGSKIVVPPGAVQVGTNVSLEKTSAPSEFSSQNLTSASDALSVNATGPDGQALDQAQAPMTVSLPLGGATLDLLADTTADNLCVLLKNRGGSLFVWRRAAISLDDSTRVAAIQSLYFGVFQLVYCGTDALSGFTDASVAGITGEAKASASMTIPGGYESARGPDKYCLTLVRSKTNTGSCTSSGGKTCEDDTTVLATAEGAVGSADQTLKVEAATSLIIDGYDNYVALFLVAGSDCPFKVADKVQDGTTAISGNLGLYAFRAATDALKAGVTGVIGDDGAYKMTTNNVGVGTPSGGSNFSIHDESAICFDMDIDGAGKAMSANSITSGAFVGGGASVAIPVALGSASPTTARLRVRIGQKCDAFDVKTSDPTTGKPYEIELDGKLGSTLFMTPVSLNIVSTNPLYQSANGCLEIFQPGTKQSIGQIEVALKSGSYPIYLPYLTDTTMQDTSGTPKYDMEVTVLGSGGTCQQRNATLPAIPLSNKLLSPTIQVSL